jgi:hypothetical protein
MDAPKDFFVSYTKSDQKWAEWIAWTLEQEQYTCILQCWDFVPGRDFMQQMREAFDTSHQVVAVLSEEYLASPYAELECNAALVKDPSGLKRALVPVRVKECELGVFLKGRIYIDLVAKDGEQAKRDLLRGIAAARLGRRLAPDEAAFDRPPKFPGGGLPSQLPGAQPALHAEETVQVLYLGSDPHGILDLEGQARQIRMILEESETGGRFSFEAVFDVTTETIFEELNKYQPNIVHFAGKQNGGNVVIRTPGGNASTIPDIALAGLLQSLDSTVVLVALDTCKSLRCARAVSEVVDFAVGVAGDIYDKDAIKYYNAFYRALAAGKSVGSACGQAAAALSFTETEERDIPRLCARPGVDPKKFRFVEPRTPSRARSRRATGSRAPR